ncbi:MAG: hypothetical protein HYR94_11770 [Chloroflexi bacterium]|nr:hypothetical protein [Chloroflexota bacterium]
MKLRQGVIRRPLAVFMGLLSLVLVGGLIWGCNSIKENQTVKNLETQCIEIANKYVETELKIPASEYQMTYQGQEPGSGLCIVKATHQEDLNPTRPVFPGAGSGKSRKLTIDPKAEKVTQALGFQ